MEDDMALALELSKQEAESAKKRKRELGDSMEQVQEVEASSVLKISTKDRGFDAALYGETVQKGFAKLYNNDLLSDITLLLGEEKIKAHKMVLGAWSETFRSMLSQEWVEGSMAELPIHVEPKDYENFKCLLKYMYTGSIDFITSENVLPLLSLSDYYGIISLKELCGELLGEQISEENLFFLLDVVQQFDCRRLSTACGAFLADHFNDMLTEDRERLMTLGLHTWAEMLRSDSLTVRTEEALFEAVMDYASRFKDEPEKRNEILTTLLPHVRFPCLKNKFLVNNVEQNPLLQSLPIVVDLLYETYKYKTLGHKPSLINAAPRKGFQKFDPEKCASSINLSDDGLVATYSTSAGWQSVRSVLPFGPKYNYCELKFTAGMNVMIGVVDGDVSYTGYSGQYSNGWTLYSQGSLYHAGSTSPTTGGFTVNDRIGLKADLAKGTVTFYKNGTVVATASNIPKNSTSVYPIVCFSAAGDSVSIDPIATDPTADSP